MSLSTRKPYRGINKFLLGFSGYTSQWWGTFDKCAELCGMVKTPDNSRKGFHWVSPDGKPRGVLKGQKSTLVVWWGQIKVWDEDENGQRVQRIIPQLRYYLVFNAEQCGEMPERYLKVPDDVEVNEFTPHDEAQRILDEYLDRDGAPTLIHGGVSCHWTPFGDEMHLPDPGRFESTAEYYMSAFHEATHSTGWRNRLNRKECVEYTRRDEEGHAYRPREELCAEMGAAMLCAMAGIDDDRSFENAASYIDGWRKRITDDLQLVIYAASRAQKAADYILDIKYEDEDPDGE